MIIKETQKLIGTMASQAATRPEGDGWAQLRSLVTHAGYAISQLRQDRGNSSVAVRQLVGTFSTFAYAYFDRFRQLLDADGVESEQRAYWRHQAIEMLCNAWERVARLVPAVNDPTVLLLEKVVDEAAPGKPWKEERGVITVPHFGRHFELVKLTYAPNIALMGVPLHNLRAPWEWSVVWHEMAGHLVERKEVKPVLEGIENKQAYLWPQWRDAYPEMPEEDEFDPAGWVAEFFEDAYGILCLGPAMVSSLESALRQRYPDMTKAQDRRHPVPTIRLAVANALLAEMGFADQAGSFDTRVQPMAQALDTVLKDSGFVRRPYDGALYEETTQLKEALLAKYPKLPETPSVPALIAAARLAFDQEPSHGPQIADAVETAVKNMAAPPSGDVDVGISEAVINQILDKVIEDCPEEKPWRALLDMAFSETDRVAAKDHEHPRDDNVSLWVKWHWTWHEIPAKFTQTDVGKGHKDLHR